MLQILGMIDEHMENVLDEMKVDRSNYQPLKNLIEKKEERKFRSFVET
jgi:hypothetical protein